MPTKMRYKPRTFGPLMTSIEQVLKALDKDAKSKKLAVTKRLRQRFKEYKNCCRRAHVILDKPKRRRK